VRWWLLLLRTAGCDLWLARAVLRVAASSVAGVCCCSSLRLEFFFFDALDACALVVVGCGWGCGGCWLWWLFWCYVAVAVVITTVMAASQTPVQNTHHPLFVFVAIDNCYFSRVSVCFFAASARLGSLAVLPWHCWIAIKARAPSSVFATPLFLVASHMADNTQKHPCKPRFYNIFVSCHCRVLRVLNMAIHTVRTYFFFCFVLFFFLWGGVE
jgi:hypothetical protein